jgi:FAD/FMN-containing dehydrogenase
MRGTPTKVRAWGNLAASEHRIVELPRHGAIQASLAGQGPGIAHGMGRSYGDVGLNPSGTLWRTTGLDRFISFDETQGRLVCEAGVLLRDIQRIMMPRGWALPVTPGTQLVTVGGAIANDVHGKNHTMQGSFGNHVHRFTLARTDGAIIDCGPEFQPDWFAATIGGLGLTGVIVEAELQLVRVPGPWLEADAIAYGSLDEFFRLTQESLADWEHTVAWFDCLSGDGGRGIFLRANPTDAGNRVEPRPRKLAMPLTPPLSLVNKLSLKPFNMAYYHLNRLKAGRRIEHYEHFFYPLDNVQNWNRMYGPKGFYQYQCVVPRDTARDALKAMLAEIARSGEGSFLAVLKTFGDRQPVGMMSFPMPGTTLALDFPNNGPRTAQLFERLDNVLREAGGRIYPAKDARMPRKLFEAGYPNLNQFVTYRDPGISSGMSRRLLGN